MAERFMERYDPEKMELSTRDVVAAAIYTEAKKVAAPNMAALISTSPITLRVCEKEIASMYHQFRELADVDITREPMEVGPTCHHMMGGISALI